MTAIIVALERARGAALTEDLREEGLHVLAVCAPEDVDEALLNDADAVLLPADRTVITRRMLHRCDRAGVRIIAVGGSDPRHLERLGLPEALAAGAGAREILSALHRSPATTPTVTSRRRVVAVWGPQGSPGRSTVAIELAIQLAGAGREVCLIDADTHAPSLALLLGLGDEAPGIAAACRRAELGELDRAELSRLSTPVAFASTRIEVLAGLNRASRWPEISAHRLRLALAACREVADDTIVDLAAPTEADEEISSDLAAPRRNAATITALSEADAIVAVVGADPLGVARFLHAHSEVRAISTAPLIVAVNRLRPGVLGLDARGQIRRTLERFAGIREVHFLSDDPRAADAAMLHARPLADIAPRSAVVAGIRRLAVALPATADSSRGSSPAARSPRR